MTHSSELEAQDVRDKVAVHTQSVPLFLFETVAEKEEEQHAEDNRVPIAAVVLNNRLPPSFGAIWAKATLRVCADGGSNRVYDHFMQSGCDEGSEPQLPPHFIVGDLDSARVATLSHFRGLGTEVIHDPDQVPSCVSSRTTVLFHVDTRERRVHCNLTRLVKRAPDLLHIAKQYDRANALPFAGGTGLG
eukprot:TRINITY_DN4937_c0_g1_i3.p1 TRINITY_DN4937_c0_g1~~TRINITY_DN4937_c0_g1_i3.p1  ORF type:complete len:189 (-),score=31.73 TRINITY_DN4937_c0_g1_i3:10-576(-)